MLAGGWTETGKVARCLGAVPPELRLVGTPPHESKPEGRKTGRIQPQGSVRETPLGMRCGGALCAAAGAKPVMQTSHLPQGIVTQLAE